MKKFYSIIALMLLFVGSAWGDNIIADNQTFTVGSECITSLDDITTGYYIILANPADNPSYLYQNTSNHSVTKTTGVYSAGIGGKNYVFKITVEDGYSSTHNLTIQAYDGYYLNSTISVNETTPTTYTASIQGTGNILNTSTSVTRFRFTYNNGTNYLNANGNSTGGGGWGQYALYPVTIQEATEEEFTIKTYYAPSGTTYKIGDTNLTITETDGIGTGTFSALASNVTNSYVTVTPPTGYSAFATVSGTTYSINFAPTVIGTTKYYSTNKPATEIEAGQWYLISQTRNGLGFAKNNNGQYYKYDTSNFPNGSTITSNNYTYLFQFVPTANENEYYIMGADGKYFGALTGNVTVTASDTKEAYSIKKVETTDGTSTYYFSIQNVSSSVVVDNNGNGNTVAGWNTDLPTSETGNSAWRFFPVSDTQVTYDVTWNISYTTGEETKTATVHQNVIEGENASLPSYAYTTVTTDDTYTNITEDRTFSAVATIGNLPFNASKSFDAATWYYVRIVSDNKYLNNSVDAGNTIPLTGTDPTLGNDDSYKWAFIGNPIDGYQVINKAAGSGYYLYNNGTPSGGDNNTHPIMGNDETAQAQRWTVFETTKLTFSSGTNNTTSANFTFSPSDYTNIWWNNRSGLSYWTGIDNGSCWYVEDVLTADAEVEANIKPVYDATTWPRLTSAGRTALESAGYGSKTTGYTANEYNNMLTVVQNAENYEFPETGYYRIKSSGSRNSAVSYIGIGNNAYGRGTAATGYGFKTITTNYDTDASTVIYLTRTSSTDNTYTMSAQHEWATGATAYDNPILMSTEESSAGTFEFAPVTSNANYAGYTTIKQASALSRNENHCYFYESGWAKDNTCVCVWDASSAPSFWQIEKVNEGDLVYSVALHDGGDNNYYATAYLPFPSKISTEGVTAYIGALNQAKDHLQLTSITGTIPANTGVVLVGSSAENAEFVLSSDDADDIANVSANQLDGVTIATTISETGNQLSLGTYEGSVGFYHWGGDLTNKAYFDTSKLGTESKGFAFSFGDDDPTGISEELIKEAVKELQGQRYNVQGQPVGADYKGIIIQNGKKYLQK